MAPVQIITFISCYETVIDGRACMLGESLTTGNQKSSYALLREKLFRRKFWVRRNHLNNNHIIETHYYLSLFFAIYKIKKISAFR